MYGSVVRNLARNRREIQQLEDKYTRRLNLQVVTNTVDYSGTWEHLQDLTDHHLRESHTYWRYPDDWYQIRKEVLQRDHFRCTECGRGADTGQLHVDHIVPLSRGGSSELSNLRTLCVKCHSLRHPGNARLAAMARRSQI